MDIGRQCYRGLIRDHRAVRFYRGNKWDGSLGVAALVELEKSRLRRFFQTSAPLTPAESAVFARGA
jgi:hypothetical protein